MRRRRLVSSRTRRAQARRVRRRVMVLLAVLALGALAMQPALRARIAQMGREGLYAAQAFAQSLGTDGAQAELNLPEMEVWALQLGVFDSGESAAQEQKRLAAEGVPCVVWQREKMRLICSVALNREGLDAQAAGGRESFVVKDALPAVSLRLSASQGDMEAALSLLRLPDALLTRLLDGGEPLDALIDETQRQAERAVTAHPENALYTQLAQSLVNWCALMRQTAEACDAQTALVYAQTTMCTLCRELRRALAGA